MNTINGNQLTTSDQAHVLRAYVNRFTREHKPAWAQTGHWRFDRETNTATPYPVQFASDADWLANTLFMVRKDGRLDRRSTWCHSTPTWPDNPELRKSAA